MPQMGSFKVSYEYLFEITARVVDKYGENSNMKSMKLNVKNVN